MKILVTGSEGFIGKNLVACLKNAAEGKDSIWNTRHIQIEEIYEFDKGNSQEELKEYCKKADFVYHLAGVNRPKEQAEFMEGNAGFSERLLELLESCSNTCPVMLASSVQALLSGRYQGSEYGRSKLAGENLFFQHGKKTGARILVYRFPNVFGKWCRPNYNSAVATFCYNMANNLPLQIQDRETELELAYIDDVTEELLLALDRKEHYCSYQENKRIPDTQGKYCYIPVTYHVTLGEIADMLQIFKEYPKTLFLPEIPAHSFQKKLYSTYLSYLSEEETVIPLHGYTDERGSFTEILKTAGCGQISVNIAKPGITKGQHWHHSKWEIFLVVSGYAQIRERRIGTKEIREYKVSGEDRKAVYMLPGYVHSITNLSDTQDLVILIWANESFDREKPDTFQEEV